MSDSQQEVLSRLREQRREDEERERIRDLLREVESLALDFQHEPEQIGYYLADHMRLRPGDLGRIEELLYSMGGMPAVCRAFAAGGFIPAPDAMPARATTADWLAGRVQRIYAPSPPIDLAATIRAEWGIAEPRRRDAAETTSMAMQTRPAPGVQAASEVVGVQFKGEPDTGDVEVVEEETRRGLEGPERRLPHRDRIRKAFGRHDVGDIAAHVDAASGAAAEVLGVEAYTRDGQVAFRKEPDLFTAAHEAVHVLQQRAGAKGRPGDEHERHADEVAETVVRGESAEELLSGLAVPPPQPGSWADVHGRKRRQVAVDVRREWREAAARARGAPDEAGHGDRAPHESEPLPAELSQRSSYPESAGESTAGEPGLEALRELLEARPAAASVPEPVRQTFEAATQTALGPVRLHEGGKATEVASLLDARALAVGRDVVFNAGELDGSTREGRELMAHELAHVAQSGLQETDPALPLRLGSRDAASEREADAVASHVAAGRAARQAGRAAAVGPQHVQRCPKGGKSGKTTDPRSKYRSALIPAAGKRGTFRYAKIYFEEGSAELDQQAQTVVKAAARKLAKLGPERVYFAGFSDSVGPAADNRQLSRDRATAVQEKCKAVAPELGRVKTAAIAMGPKGRKNRSDRRWRRVDIRVRVTTPVPAEPVEEPPAKPIGKTAAVRPPNAPGGSKADSPAAAERRESPETAAKASPNPARQPAPKAHIPDPRGMGYQTILAKAGSARAGAVSDLASLETPSKFVDIFAFKDMDAARRSAILALEPFAVGTACHGWFDVLRANNPGGPPKSAEESAAGERAYGQSNRQGRQEARAKREARVREELPGLSSKQIRSRWKEDKHAILAAVSKKGHRLTARQFHTIFIRYWAERYDAAWERRESLRPPKTAAERAAFQEAESEMIRCKKAFRESITALELLRAVENQGGSLTLKELTRRVLSLGRFRSDLADAILAAFAQSRTRFGGPRSSTPSGRTNRAPAKPAETTAKPVETTAKPAETTTKRTSRSGGEVLEGGTMDKTVGRRHGPHGPGRSGGEVVEGGSMHKTAGRQKAGQAATPEAKKTSTPNQAGGQAAAKKKGTTTSGSKKSKSDQEHARELGFDPATKKFRQNEADTALRVEKQEGVRLKRYEPAPGEKGDWVDPAKGTVYDGCSPPPSRYFDRQISNGNYEKSLTKHVNHPTVDKVVVDTTGLGLTPAQLKTLDKLLAGYGSKIVRIR